MTKNVLITGITGFVGSHLVDYLLRETDFTIYGLARIRSPLDNIAHHIGRINKGDRLHLLYGDLRDAASLRKAVATAEPDYVFHLAAQSFPQYSFTAAGETLDCNVQGTLHLLEAVGEFAPKAWTHVCSSSEVYGKVAQENTPITESCPFHPASPYAISKVGTDLLGQHYAERGMNVMVTRMFTHTGPRRGDVFAESSFAKQIAMIEADQIEPIVHVGNLESKRTVADVRDAVRAYYTMLVERPKRGAVYNIAGDAVLTVKDILFYLLSNSPAKIDIKLDPRRLRPVDADLQIADCTRFRTDTFWKPEIQWHKTLRDLLVFWREAVHAQRFLVR
jgi:GDPmannose 4,6-dehydratase